MASGLELWMAKVFENSVLEGCGSTRYPSTLLLRSNNSDPHTKYVA